VIISSDGFVLSPARWRFSLATKVHFGTGWVPDAHDARDLTWRHSDVAPALKKTGIAPYLDDKLGDPIKKTLAMHDVTPELPSRVDLEPWCPAVRFQGGFNTCAAHVATALLEMLENKAFGEKTDASRLFVYKVTKNFLQAEGNVGVYIRQAVGALRLIGAPPEKYWPYPETGSYGSYLGGGPPREDPVALSRLDDEPTAFCYALARDYRSLKSYRLDETAPNSKQTPAELVVAVKAHLAAGVPTSFGFPLYSTAVAESLDGGEIGLPPSGEKAAGRHAVVAIGYDDAREIATTDGATTTRGAFKVHNSWSVKWGDDGHGWIPYDYVTTGLTRDFWTVTSLEYVETGRFKLDI
jgi:C1A family cysteine protease